jgi:putative transposase
MFARILIGVVDVKFGFVAKHPEIWPVDWLCGSLAVSRNGYNAWRQRPLRQRARSDAVFGT